MVERSDKAPAEAVGPRDERASRGLAMSDVVQAGVLIALLAVSAQVSVAIGPVPFTLQTLVVVLAALVFSPGQAALALIGYVILGTLGLPIFSAFRGGLAMIAGPTGGYIYGFILSAVIGALVRRAICPPAQRASHKRRSLAADVVAGVVAVLICYTIGTIHFMIVSAAGGSSVDLIYVLGVCVVPFILPDAAKMVAAILVALALRRAIPSMDKR